jgi:twitching motility protein PilI
MVNKPDYFTGDNQEISSEIQELKTPEGELHLRFFLPSEDEFALPATGIKEVMQQSPDRITAIPNASPLLLGTINLRGQIIWVADLGQFLGDSKLVNTDRGEIPVIAVEDQETILGLAVDSLGEMEWLDLERLQLSANVPDLIAPYVQGEWAGSEGSEQKSLRLLDHVAILRSARWAV